MCDDSYVSTLVTSIQMGGVILGAFAFGQLSDLIGRKISYYLAHLMICVGGFACSFANTWHVSTFMHVADVALLHFEITSMQLYMNLYFSICFLNRNCFSLFFGVNKYHLHNFIYI